ncbi:MAG: NADP-dependent oxidoreductase [Myxococcota bacterium]
MNVVRNRQVRLVKRPNGTPTPDIFSPTATEVASLAHGQFLVRNLYLSMDPALVSRMRDEDNYAESVVVGDVMHAYGIGQVMESRLGGVKKGDVLLGRFDMQEYAVCDDATVRTKINVGLAQPSWYLGAVGVTGATAYFGLTDIGKPQAGETVVISSGGSSVGATAAQLAKMRGCRTVAIVSTDHKAERTKRRFGYDAAVSYRNKSVEALSADLHAACPKGVDVYFDNTGGDISEALLDLYNEFARIVVCGRVATSHLADTKLDRGRRDQNVILTKRIRKQGFVLLDYKRRMPEATLQLAKWVKQGRITLDEDVLEGIEEAPNAFFRMLEGRNRGKQLVRLAELDESLLDGSARVGRLLTSRLFPTARLAHAVGKRAAAQLSRR